MLTRSGAFVSHRARAERTGDGQGGAGGTTGHGRRGGSRSGAPGPGVRPCRVPLPGATVPGHRDAVLCSPCLASPGLPCAPGVATGHSLRPCGHLSNQSVPRGLCQACPEEPFFCSGQPLKTASKDHQPATATNRKLPPTNRQLPPPANRQLPSPANRHQPPITNHQPPPTTANRQSPVANRQPPTIVQQCFCGLVSCPCLDQEAERPRARSFLLALRTRFFFCCLQVRKLGPVFFACPVGSRAYNLQVCPTSSAGRVLHVP